jgi:hypothetical protein
MRQVWSQSIRRRRPQLLWMGAEGWLRQRVKDGRDYFYRDIVFLHLV